jgi:hypothetical protein
MLLMIAGSMATPGSSSMVGKDRARIGVKISRLMMTRIDLELETAELWTVSPGAEQAIFDLPIRC